VAELELSKKKQVGKHTKIKRETPQQIRRKWAKKCHTHWSHIVRDRDNYKCVWCGRRSKTVQAHHIVAQSRCNTMACYDPKNGMTLCFNCHIHQLKADPDTYIDMRDMWLRARGLNYQDMNVLFKSRTKVTLDDLKLLCGDLERQSKGCTWDEANNVALD